jgi:hypothetical protein
MLGKLLKSTSDNSAVTEELYLQTLSREPTDKERETALKYCKGCCRHDELDG